MSPRTGQLANEMDITAARTASHSLRTQFGPPRTLPFSIAALNEIAQNFYWSWLPHGGELFRELDWELWERCEQNPGDFLSKVSEVRLLKKSTDAVYVERVASVKAQYEEYLTQLPKDQGRIGPASPVAYFCAEYGIHNSLPIYSGGLGILAGDHLKSASDLGVPLVAIGLLYRYGYFRQSIAHDGWQEENYFDLFEQERALTPVVDPDGSRTIVTVRTRGREVFAQAWLVRVGRIHLYLLDTSIDENIEVDRLITGHLYGGSSETRIVQEKLLGIGGVRLLRKLGITPSVYHLNEGHSAFLTLELVRELVTRDPSLTFAEAANLVREQCVFTTHTPVSAGNDIFSFDDIRACFDLELINSLGLAEEEFFELGRVPGQTGFGMTPLAMNMSRSTNGVSEKHGEVSRELWQPMFGEALAENVPITHVTNGVHTPTWIASLYQIMYKTRIGRDWQKVLADPAEWSRAIAAIPSAEIWGAHSVLKKILIAYLRERTQRRETGRTDTIHEHLDTHTLFSPDVLTIGFARRVAAYKRWDLVLTDLDRLLRLVDDPARPVQFVFAGKAHPQDRTAKEILQHLMSIDHDSNWQRRAVFLEDYDQDVARYLVQGVDVWMNVPRRPFEASGTSGMKAAMNGALNFSILDGWWIEGFNGSNGFAIGELEPDPDDAAGDAADAESLYRTLEDIVVPAFYDRDANGLPTQWIDWMRDAMATLTPAFSSDRMVRDYLERIYLAQEQPR